MTKKNREKLDQSIYNLRQLMHLQTVQAFKSILFNEIISLEQIQHDLDEFEDWELCGKYLDKSERCPSCNGISLGGCTFCGK